MAVDLTSTTFVDELGDGGLRWVAPGDEWVSNGKVFDIFLWNLKTPKRDPLVDENSFVKGLGQQLIPNLGASLPRTALKIQQNGHQNPQNFEIIADKNQQGIHWHVRTLAFDWADLSSVINL